MKFLSYLDKLEKENRWQFWIILVLIAVVFIEGILLFRASTHKVVVVIPPRVEKEFWVAGNTLSRAYVEQVALFIADRLLSVSPENVDTSLSAIYPFLTTSPEGIKAIEEQFKAYSATIKREDWSQAFYPMRVVITEKNIGVEGMLRKIAGNTYVGQERKTLNLGYKVESGRLIITEVKF